jgi:hypothetical protein
MTSSTATLSLFAEPSMSPRRPASIVLSILAHAAVAGAIYYGITHLPRIEAPAALLRYPARAIDLRVLDPDFPQTPNLHEPASRIPYPSPEVIRQLATDPPQPLEQKMRSFLSEAARGPLLLQPDIHSQLSFAPQVPVPTLTIWEREPLERALIVPPPPDLLAASSTKPSSAPPAFATRPGVIPSLDSETPSARAITSPSTSALVNQDLDQSGTAATFRPSLQPETSAAVLSIAEIFAPNRTLLLLPAREVPPSAGALRTVANLSLPKENSAAEEADDITADGRRLSADHLLLPKNGKFNIVVVGSSLQDQYPETARIWATRVPYTAYMHVGLDKSWILQYSATREADLAGAGRVERMNAPWPYDIRRPNIDRRDLHASALIVHGILNPAGRLESLAVAAPSGFRYASFVLRMLREWQFRPALQNGHATPVEVLLIIPEERN